jgi:dTDP-4-dehydrorhamnose 3,5-epimerase
MKFTKTEIEGCFLITYDTYVDSRGYFSVPYNKEVFNSNVGYDVEFVQDNMSYSHLGTIRGLHYQSGVSAQSKLVSCTQGRVLDVAVDIRKDSPTYGNVVKVELGWSLNNQLFVPKGCAHGFSVLSTTAIFQYKVDNPYNKESEGGIIYNDPTLNIDWGVSDFFVRVSEKDLELPTFLSL